MNSTLFRKMRCWFGVVSLAVLIVFLIPHNASSIMTMMSDGGGGYTEITDDIIKKRSVYRVLQECYMDGESLRKTISYTDAYGSPPSIVDGKYTVFDGKKEYGVPTGLIDGGDWIRCAHENAGFFSGAKAGIIEYMFDYASNGRMLFDVDLNSEESRTAFYKGMGYTPSYSGSEAGGSSSSGNIEYTDCYKLEFETNNSTGTSNTLCIDFDNKENIVGISSDDSTISESAKSGGSIPEFTLYLGGNFGNLSFHDHFRSYWACKTFIRAMFNPKDIYNYSAVQNESAIYCSENTGGSTPRQDIMVGFNSLSPYFEEEILYSGGNSEIVGSSLSISFHREVKYYDDEDSDDSNTPIAYNKYDISDPAKSLREAKAYLGDQSVISSNFDDTELYYIYMHYFDNFGDGEKPRIGQNTCYEENPNSEMYIPVVIKENNTKVLKYCVVDNYAVFKTTNNTASETLATGAKMDARKKYYLPDLIKLINGLGAINVKRLPARIILSDDGSAAFVDQGETEIIDNQIPQEEVNCANSGAAESLGWILCPVLDLMVKSSEKMYNLYIVPSLQIKPKLFENRSGDNDDTKDAWAIFQNIANIFFVILFMVVIFSQLTGYGIDNYGIKKILPKLLIVAIMVNLSYYICLICIDLSNIVGNGIQAMFDGLAKSMTVSLPSGGGASGAGATAITAVVLLGSLAVVGVAVWKNPAILLALLVSALGVVIAVLFLFVILSAREAAIVMLTVVSPVALVCFILPNTKKLFDRWLKFWEGLLLVYPICGLLVGGGNFVSKLLLTTGAGDESNGFFQSFTAMLIGIVPIFFIPTVLKSSFVAMGNIGAKISGFGDRMRSGATRGIRNSGRFKNAQERGLERRTRINAGLNRNGEVKETGRIGNFLRGGRRNMARSRAQYLKDQDARKREGSLMDVGFDAAMVGQTKKAEAEETANYMTLINDKTRNGEDENALLSMYDDYISKGNKAGAVAVARIAGRRKDTAASFLNKRITGYGLSEDETRRVRASNSAHSDIFRSVAKEVSTGENSRMYRESTPLGFEFAAQYNRSGNNIDYTDWSSSGENIGRAVDNYITNSQELVGAKNGSLSEIAEKMENGTLDEAHVSRLRNLARETINNRATTGVWDSTKSENIYRIAGMEMLQTAGVSGGIVTATPITPATPRPEISIGDGVLDVRGGNINGTSDGA